jgi:hypothetical protein
MWESGGITPPFFTTAIDGGEWSASRSGDKLPGTHLIEGLVGPSEDLDVKEKRKSLAASGNITQVLRPVSRSSTE